MDNTTSTTPKAPRDPSEDSHVSDPWLDHSVEIRKGLKRLDRKQWWMWSSAMVVILLLTIGMAHLRFRH
jgi:hypothetical protein